MGHDAGKNHCVTSADGEVQPLGHHHHLFLSAVRLHRNALGQAVAGCTVKAVMFVLRWAER